MHVSFVSLPVWVRFRRIPILLMWTQGAAGVPSRGRLVPRTVEAVSGEVVFTSGFVTLGNGRLVPERRDTAWQAACDPAHADPAQ